MNVAALPRSVEIKLEVKLNFSYDVGGCGSEGICSSMCEHLEHMYMIVTKCRL